MINFSLKQSKTYPVVISGEFFSRSRGNGAICGHYPITDILASVSIDDSQPIIIITLLKQTSVFKDKEMVFDIHNITDNTKGNRSCLFVLNCFVMTYFA